MAFSTQPVRERVSAEEWALRVALAACHRLFAELGMVDLIFNHITARVPGAGHEILISPYGMAYDELTASTLHKIDLDGNILMAGVEHFGVNPAGYVIHSAVHGARADAACVIHTHTRASSAVSAMESGLLPISQHAMNFVGHIAYHDYDRPGKLDERPRLVADLGDRNSMILRNHGTLTVGQSVAHAFLLAHRLEMACRIQVDALSGGTLVMPPPATYEGLGGRGVTPSVELVWQAMLRRLDRRDPSYAD